MSQDDAPAPLRRARALDGADATAAHYARWAEAYDHDVFDLAGVIGSSRIADLLAEHLPDRGAAVVDLGCGTGAVGVRLRTLGFTVVDGVDLSPEMLAVAERHAVYRHLAVADLTAPAVLGDAAAVLGSCPPDGYDASIAAGVFTTGHLGAREAAELVAWVRPGGVVAWVVADPSWDAIEPAIIGAGLDLRFVGHEPIRRDAPPEARMIVGVRRPVAPGSSAT